MVIVKVGIKNSEINNLNVENSGITIMELLTKLNIDISYVGGVLVDGIPKKLNVKVKDNSEIYILPLL